MHSQEAFVSTFTPQLHPTPKSLSKRSNAGSSTARFGRWSCIQLDDRPTPATKPASTTKTPKTDIDPPRKPLVLYENLIGKESATGKDPPPLPHHYRLPIVGLMMDKMDPNHAVEARRKYGPIYTTTFLNPTDRMTVVANRHYVFSVLKEKGETFHANGAYPKTMDEMFAQHETMKDGDEHVLLKSMTLLPFRAEFFNGIFKGLAAIFDNAWKTFDVSDVQGGENEGEYKAAFETMAESTFRIMLGITIGWNEIDDQKLDVSHVRELFGRVGKAFFTPRWPFGLGLYGSGIRARNELASIVKAVMDKRAQTHGDVIQQMRLVVDNVDPGLSHVREAVSFVNKLMSAGKVDFVSLLMAMFGTNDGNDTRYESTVVMRSILGFWFAGTETTASLLTTALNELGRRPNVLKRLIREQDLLTASETQNGGDSAELTMGQLTSMPMLDAFFHELFRLFGPGTGVFRKLASDVTLAGHSIKKGSFLFCDIRAATQDEDLFPDPSKFDIDRYLHTNATSPQEVSLRKQTAMLGFGAGPHVCTGSMLAKLEFKTAMSILLRKYHFELDPEASHEYNKLSIERPKSGSPIRLTRR